MKKGIVAFIILAFIIPGLFVAAKLTFPPKDANQKSEDVKKSTDKKPTEPISEYVIIDGPQLLPVDESSQNAGFEKFREELLAAVRSKDVDFLKRHIDEKIRYTFGENSGIDGFIKEWNLDKDPEHSALWAELEEVISLGGTFDSRNAFVAPYVFSNFPETVDGFVYLAVIDKNVKLYSKPDLKSDVIGIINYNLVRDIEFKKAQPWQKVIVQKDVAGYVQSKYLRSPVDYRAFFENKSGSWKIVFFVAGD